MDKIIAVAILVASFIGFGAMAVATYPPELCKAEDSVNCIWLAGVQGNGKGLSFIDYNGTAFYFGAEAK